MTSLDERLCPVCGAERVDADEGRICCANRECPAFAVPVDGDLAGVDFKGLLAAYEKMVADGEDPRPVNRCWCEIVNGYRHVADGCPTHGHLASLTHELEAAWRAAEGFRMDDPFAWRIMLRLGRALVNFHEAVHEDIRDARSA